MLCTYVYVFIIENSAQDNKKNNGGCAYTHIDI